jgi:peptidoglycan/xylan/chitin deacetylase (PgdA/CDA1 family)
MSPALDLNSLRDRREQRRRALRRRRRMLALALVGVAAAAVLAVVVLGAGGKTPARYTAAAGGASVAHTGQQTSSGAATKSATAAPPASGSGTPGRTAVPILMYHVIKAPPAGAPFPGLYVTQEEFTAQMEALKHAGWHAVTLDEVQAHWTNGAPLGAGKPIVLSFDNGYQSQYSTALPVLRRLGWVGVENLQLSGLPPSQGGLSQRETKALVAAGWELDTQGFTHADLITLDAAALRHEVADSRSLMSRRYGVAVNWFCYPSGHYDATVIAAVRAAGYEGATTVVPGWAKPGEDRYRMHRLRVLGGTSAAQLLDLVEGVRADPAAPPSYNGA